MSNTTQRILSAFVLALVVSLSIYYGTKATLGLFVVISVLAIDEIVCNLFNRKRFSARYFLSQLIFTAPFVYLSFVCKSEELISSLSYVAVFLNFILIYYLFFVDMNSKILIKVGKNLPEFAGILILLPLIALSSLTYHSEWKMLLATLLLVNFGMDTGAWLFGKNFGKHKLWRKVSPNKTIEGLIGGMFTAGIVGSIAWYYFFGGVSVTLVLLFCFLGAMSQVGDLIQSKVKRQVGVKDSSSLIPGHGGVYDRIDSLIFLSPFYVMVLKLIYK